MSNQKKKKHASFEGIEEKLLPPDEGIEPLPLSVILPVYNCSEAIDATLQSVEKQNYAPLELIVVDAGSTDRTLEIVNSYASLITRIYTVADFNLPDMLNRGISLATGQYLTFLFPGTTYLTDTTYHYFSKCASENTFPDLIHCGSIQREVQREPHTIQLPFDEKVLKSGRHPATLPACWFHSDLFERMGKFNPDLTLRPGFEFFCRITHEQGIRTVAIDRILVDFDYGRFSYGKVLRFATETWQTISAQYGSRKALIWFLSINHIDMVKWLWHHFKSLVFKK